MKKETVKWLGHSEKAMTHAEAIRWCAKQGGRLPTIHELLDAYLSDEEGFGPYWYWSSTMDKDSSYNAYYQSFTNGGVGRGGVGNNNYVRCVA